MTKIQQKKYILTLFPVVIVDKSKLPVQLDCFQCHRVMSFTLYDLQVLTLCSLPPLSLESAVHITPVMWPKRLKCATAWLLTWMWYKRSLSWGVRINAQECLRLLWTNKKMSSADVLDRGVVDLTVQSKSLKICGSCWSQGIRLASGWHLFPERTDSDSAKTRTTKTLIFTISRRILIYLSWNIIYNLIGYVMCHELFLQIWGLMLIENLITSIEVLTATLFSPNQIILQIFSSNQMTGALRIPDVSNKLLLLDSKGHKRTHLVIKTIIAIKMSTRTPMVMPIRIILLLVDLE